MTGLGPAAYCIRCPKFKRAYETAKNAVGPSTCNPQLRCVKLKVQNQKFNIRNGVISMPNKKEVNLFPTAYLTNDPHNVKEATEVLEAWGLSQNEKKNS